MPLIRFDMIEGRSPDEIKELLDTTHRMLCGNVDRHGLRRDAMSDKIRPTHLAGGVMQVGLVRFHGETSSNKRL